MNLDHPIMKQAWNVVGLREMAWQQAQAWDSTVAEIEALEPGDPTAEAILRGATNLLQSITINYGAHDWTVQQSWLIFQTAERVFGKGQQRVNKPAVRLSGPTARAGGDEMNYKHNKLRSGAL